MSREDEVLTPPIESVDVDMLRAMFVDRKIWEEHKNLLKDYMLTEVAWGLLGDLEAYYTEFPLHDKVDEVEFKSWFRLTRHSGWKTEKHLAYSSIIGTLTHTSSPLSATVVRAMAVSRINKTISDAATSGRTEEIPGLLKDLEALESGTTKGTTKIVTESIEDVINASIRYGGLTWRLNDMNVSAGPLSKGDFVIVGKRPETGGTSFLCSELTHMVKELPEGKNVLLVNNEEYKTKVISRLVCAALNIDAPTLYGDPKKYGEDYRAYLGDHRIDVMSDGSISTLEIEDTLKRGNYGLVAINVLEKVKVFGDAKSEDYQRIEKLGQWCRSLALQYGPVFAVAQSDASSEGMMYPDMSMIYKSKTGLQSEADVLIMIGKNNDPSSPPENRYINVAKNKLPGVAASTIPKHRHIKSEVHFDIDTGRFTSKVFK